MTQAPNHLNTPEEIDEPLLYEHHRVVADKGQSLLRVDKFLLAHLQNTSRNRIQKAAEAGFIHVNDRPVKSNYRVKPCDVVCVMLNYERYDTTIEPEDIPLDIAFEDDDIIVVNKPAGMVVHPGCGNYTSTLVNAIAWHLKDNKTFNANDPEVGLVHRIDKDTSGLLVIAKTPQAKTKLGLQFFNKTTSRLYNALVWGDFDTNQGTIIGNIARDPRDRLRMAVFDPNSGIGKHAVTHWRVLRRYRYVTLIECRLETGRTHQIRAHMKHIGHPLFADARYGGDQILRGTTQNTYTQFVKRCLATCPRQALHAKTLGFVHPSTQQQINLNSQWPTDFKQLIDLWENYTTTNLK
ncbi:MAG: RluA family pseudouridine synthase [Bacteroidaceae bacterium]|nr:RluA family pseudouridine synthase [Prevotellaceae bacterium]MDY3064098.1 RluA family pseudouridine synthase [Bacteroidaceae bacterium]